MIKTKKTITKYIICDRCGVENNVIHIPVEYVRISQHPQNETEIVYVDLCESCSIKFFQSKTTNNIMEYIKNE